MIELPAEIFAKAETIVFDTVDGVVNEAGDVMNALNTKAIQETDITGELGQLVLGSITGRQGKQGITLFKTVGSAVLDVVTAQLIVKKALEKGIGTIIDL